MERTNKLQDRIEQLIFMADTFQLMVEDMNDLYFKRRDRFLKSIRILNSLEHKAIVLHHNIYFHEVVSILGTLFEKKSENRDPQEVSFVNLFRSNTDVSYKEAVEKASGKFYGTFLPGIRDKIVAHKDFRNIGDPANMHTNPVAKEHIVAARSVIDDLIQMNSIFNPYPTANNYTDDWRECTIPIIEAYEKLYT